jgi:hypothetical protein
LLALLVVVWLEAGAWAKPRAAAQVSAADSPARGWDNPLALDLAKEGIAAKSAGDFSLCVQRDRASLALEEHPYVRLHISACLSAMGRVLEALESAKTALAAGIRFEDPDLTRAGQARVQVLLPRIAHVTLQVPKSVEGIKVTFDGVPVRPHLIRQRIAVDPGDHVVVAERIDRGERSSFREDVTLKDGEDRIVEVVIKPTSLTSSERECAERAASYEAKIACFERATTRPSVMFGMDMSGYTDSLGVHVLSPAVRTAVVSPTGGWNIGGSYLIDFVTAASPDIVSMASRRFREQRHAGSLSGGYKIGPLQPQLTTNVSSEPDYLSMTAGAALAAELNDKLVTPRVAYSFSRDRIGIRSTPFSQFERNLSTHLIEGGVTFVLSPSTLLVVSASVQLERGEGSKLYRFVPMFAQEDLKYVRAGMPANDVNLLREDVRARESLPRERDRFAVGARLNRRLDNATLRIEQRLYNDSWGIKATTTDGRYLVDLGSRLRVWPHLRFHYQTAAVFHRLAYPVLLDDSNVPLQLYSYRTGDRELSQMMTVTTGGGLRVELSPARASIKYALVASGDVMWSKFFASLFVKHRTAVYGTVGLEVEL